MPTYVCKMYTGICSCMDTFRAGAAAAAQMALFCLKDISDFTDKVAADKFKAIDVKMT